MRILAVLLVLVSTNAVAFDFNFTKECQARLNRELEKFGLGNLHKPASDAIYEETEHAIRFRRPMHGTKSGGINFKITSAARDDRHAFSVSVSEFDLFHRIQTLTQYYDADCKVKEISFHPERSLSEVKLDAVVCKEIRNFTFTHKETTGDVTFLEAKVREIEQASPQLARAICNEYAFYFNKPKMHKADEGDSSESAPSK